jgi:tRNA-splicing ligase RtcB
LKDLRKRFENAIPVGFNMHDEPIEPRKLGLGDDLNFWHDFMSLRAAGVDKLEERALRQMGTLGGGNHFIELTTDSGGAVWITLHSGSRGIGNELAKRHIDIARSLPQNADMPKHLKELSLFYKGTPEMDAYLFDLTWAQEYAMRSRTMMMALVKRELFNYSADYKGYGPSFADEINCHHNYVATEIIDGREMIVTRKGAISAKEGELALIPGSMATGSYIVRGQGNPLSFQSASHGAGRKMSRSQAKRTFTVEDLERTMQGIEARTDAGVIDEISLAYKDLDSVIAAQTDLVEVVEKLDTILCVKG